MKKIVLQIDLYGGKEKQKAMKVVSSVSGINSISMDMNERKMTVIGEMDPVDIVGKLRKYWHTEVVFVGPPEEPEIEEAKKEEDEKEDMMQMVKAAIELAGHHSPHRTTHYYVHSVEEGYQNNACVIL